MLGIKRVSLGEDGDADGSDGEKDDNGTFECAATESVGKGDEEWDGDKGHYCDQGCNDMIHWRVLHCMSEWLQK